MTNKNIYDIIIKRDVKLLKHRLEKNMKINFDLKLSGKIEHTLEWLELTDIKEAKEKVKEYLLEEIEDNFESFYHSDGILNYNKESLNFNFELSENEKVVLENNVVSKKIIIKDFTSLKNLPKNGYAIIDDGSLVDINIAIQNRIDFDRYLICKEMETKGKFIENVIGCFKDDTCIAWIDIENKRWENFDDLIFGNDKLKKEIKENNLGYFSYLEY